MKKRRIYIVLCVAICMLVFGRIYYVTAHARLPKLERLAQGERGIYRGVEYQVTGATLWDAETFNSFCYGDGGPAYDDGDVGEKRVLLVEYSMCAVEDENIVDWYVPLLVFHSFNGPNMEAVGMLNSGFMEGEFSSGDILYLPYNIYRENFTDKQWEQILNFDAAYTAVMGFYPERKEFVISDVEEGRQDGQDICLGN